MRQDGICGKVLLGLGLGLSPKRACPEGGQGGIAITTTLFDLQEYGYYEVCIRPPRAPLENG